MLEDGSVPKKRFLKRPRGLTERTLTMALRWALADLAVGRRARRCQTSLFGASPIGLAGQDPGAQDVNDLSPCHGRTVLPCKDQLFPSRKTARGRTLKTSQDDLGKDLIVVIRILH